MIRRISLTVCLVSILMISVLPVLTGLIGGAGNSPSYPMANISMATTNSTFSWNPRVTCTPLVVRITDITANSTQSTSFSSSPFTPGITTTVPGGFAKRWLTPGPTPPGWVAPGPQCTVTNSFGTTSVFVQINGVERNDLTNEDYVTTYDATNGGTTHANSSDTTFNLFDPVVVPHYFTSCVSATDPTCYGRVHAEIDHDWKAAGYCGAGTFCDNVALANQTITASTMIDVQGFVSWDPVNTNTTWHQFNGWEIHPLTAWKLSSVPPPPPPGSPDFTMTTSSSSASFNTGSTSTVTVQLASVNGFAGTVSLSASVSPSTGLTAACSPSSIILSSGGTSASTCTFSSSTPGTYTVVVNGTSGSLFHSATITLTVTVEKHDFAITASPSSLALYPGATGTSTITIIAGTVFHRTVTLATSISPGLTATINPTSIAISGNATLTVSPAAVGNYTVTVTGSTTTGLTHSVIVTVSVVDFAISANPTSLTLNAGTPGSTTITITPVNGFNKTVALTTTASPGLSTTLSPSTVTGAATSTLTVNAPTSGNYTVSVTGTSGPLSHTTAVITVKVVDFTISSSPALATFNAGESGITTVTIAGLNGFTGAVNLSTTTSPGLTASLSTATITGSGTSTLTLSALALGNYTVTLTGSSGSLVHTLVITVRVGDFTMSVSPSSFTIVQGSTDTITVTLTSVNGFTGTININQVASRTSGIAVTCSSSSVTLAQGQTVTVNCSVTGLSNGNYTITLTGTSGPIFHTTTISVRVRQH